MNKTTVRELLDLSRGKGVVASIFLDTDRSTRSPKEIAIDVKNVIRQIESEKAFEPIVTDMASRLDQMSEGLLKGWAVYADPENGVFYEVALPGSISTRVHLGSTPVLFPMVALTSPMKRVLVIETDNNKAKIYYYLNDFLREISSIEGDVPSRVRSAGWYGLAGKKIERHVEQRVLDHLKDVASQIKELLGNGSRYDAVMVGGNSSAAEDLLELLKGETGLATVVKGSFGISTKLQNLREFVRDFCFREFALEAGETTARIVTESNKKGLAVAGLKPVLDSLNKNAVQRLVLKSHVPVKGVVCNSCGFVDLGESKCPVCAEALSETDDIMENMLHKAYMQDADVTILGFESSLMPYDGIGAMLRFR